MNNKKLVPTIVVENLILREPSPKDIETRLNYGRLPEFRKMFGKGMKNVSDFSRDDAINWYEIILSQPGQWWVIEMNNKMIGTTKITPTNQISAKYSIGIYDENLLNKGIGTKATKAMVQYAFEVKGLDKLSLIVLDINKRAINCYKKCGFIEKELLKDNAYIDDVYYDDLLMEITKDEYEVWKNENRNCGDIRIQ